ncbi:MBL fold metallo-hydrolase [Mangrovactinospora gilvigrisea]|uniref:MBL fold metallo-hydrolase n=1 Tax=Mangrovactinospora gilvigrisea TaxID=1428644 RepID=A0A1J7BRG8_9ACTN|nr:MBL fold metallo-hydrolase [Mangrovactinospora gilvigrisea]OIV36041.1 MBL fold metallo-hydrolase [Mangrovactinospora gilvigrisea]
MRLTHYVHACVLVEETNADGRTVRILIDPGAFSTGFQDRTDLDAVLITHEHFDHLDLENLPALLAANPDAVLLADPGSGKKLAEAGIAHRELAPGDRVEVQGLPIEVSGGKHAVIHPDIPQVDNNGYLIAGKVFHPGDSYAEPPAGSSTDVLLAPAGGPWLKAEEMVDYVRKVAPRIAVPIHQAILIPPAQDLYHGLMANLAPKGTEVTVLEQGTPTEV